MQPLEFLVITSDDLCGRLFRHLKWAGYISPNGNPKPGCEPAAYIIVLINRHKVSHSIMKRDETGIRYSFKVDERDVGAAVAHILLYAQSQGIASCWLGAIDKTGIRRLFCIPKHFEVDTVIALGYPKMKARVAKYKSSVKYWLDSRGTLHVPKRRLEDVLHINGLRHVH